MEFLTDRLPDAADERTGWGHSAVQDPTIIEFGAGRGVRRCGGSVRMSPGITTATLIRINTREAEVPGGDRFRCRWCASQATRSD